MLSVHFWNKWQSCCVENYYNNSTLLCKVAWDNVICCFTRTNWTESKGQWAQRSGCSTDVQQEHCTVLSVTLRDEEPLWVQISIHRWLSLSSIDLLPEVGPPALPHSSGNKNESEHLVKLVRHTHTFTTPLGLIFIAACQWGHLGLLIALIMVRQRAEDRPVLRCLWRQLTWLSAGHMSLSTPPVAVYSSGMKRTDA